MLHFNVMSNRTQQRRVARPPTVLGRAQQPLYCPHSTAQARNARHTPVLRGPFQLERLSTREACDVQCKTPGSMLAGKTSATRDLSAMLSQTALRGIRASDVRLPRVCDRHKHIHEVISIVHFSNALTVMLIINRSPHLMVESGCAFNQAVMSAF
jgi:hypothetical protein